MIMSYWMGLDCGTLVVIDSEQVLRLHCAAGTHYIRNGEDCDEHWFSKFCRRVHAVRYPRWLRVKGSKDASTS